MGKKTEQATDVVKTVTTIAGAVASIGGVLISILGNNDKK